MSEEAVTLQRMMEIFRAGGMDVTKADIEAALHLNKIAPVVGQEGQPRAWSITLLPTIQAAIKANRNET